MAARTGRACAINGEALISSCQILMRDGIAVLVVDNRGMGARGKKFAAALIHNFGEVELKDQLASIDQALEISAIELYAARCRWRSSPALVVTKSVFSTAPSTSNTSKSPLVIWLTSFASPPEDSLCRTNKDKDAYDHRASLAR